MSTLRERLIQLTTNQPRGWQAKLAQQTGVKQPSVSAWLSGKTKTINGDALIKAAQFFQCSPEWLATGKGPTFIHDGQTLRVMEPSSHYGRNLWPFKNVTPSQWGLLSEAERDHIETTAAILISNKTDPPKRHMPEIPRASNSA